MRSAREQRPRRSQPVNENRNGSLISVCLGHQEPVTSVLMFSFKLNVVPNHKKKLIINLIHVIWFIWFKIKKSYSFDLQIQIENHKSLCLVF